MTLEIYVRYLPLTVWHLFSVLPTPTFILTLISNFYSVPIFTQTCQPKHIYLTWQWIFCANSHFIERKPLCWCLIHALPILYLLHVESLTQCDAIFFFYVLFHTSAIDLMIRVLYCNTHSFKVSCPKVFIYFGLF